MEARVTAHSQAFRLRERMEQAQVRHGQEIRADLPGIRVRAMAGSWLGTAQGSKAEVFFCSMGALRVRTVSIDGDVRQLPTQADVQGLEIAAEGTYDLLNALVRSNGKLRVVVDDVTAVVPRPRIRDLEEVIG
jgi:hypothetical protein